MAARAAGPAPMPEPGSTGPDPATSGSLPARRGPGASGLSSPLEACDCPRHHAGHTRQYRPALSRQCDSPPSGFRRRSGWKEFSRLGGVIEPERRARHRTTDLRGRHWPPRRRPGILPSPGSATRPQKGGIGACLETRQSLGRAGSCVARNGPWRFVSSRPPDSSAARVRADPVVEEELGRGPRPRARGLWFGGRAPARTRRCHGRYAKHAKRGYSPSRCMLIVAPNARP